MVLSAKTASTKQTKRRSLHLIGYGMRAAAKMKSILLEMKQRLTITMSLLNQELLILDSVNRLDPNGIVKKSRNYF